jgi:uncharacterized protein (TIRG00374 family)
MCVSFGNGYRLAAIGTLFNFAIPGGTGGDVMKLYYLTTGNRGRIVEMAVVLLVNRVTALFSLMCLIVSLALVNGQLVIDHPQIRWLVTAAVVGIVVLLIAAVISFSAQIRASRWYSYLMAKMPLHNYLERAFDALYAFRDHKMALVVAALCSFLGHLALAGLFLMVGRVLIPSAPGLVICLLSLMGIMANALPITPGGLGIGEAAFDLLFGLVGMAGGAFLILLWRLGMLPLCTIGCILYIKGVRSRQLAFTG